MARRTVDLRAVAPDQIAASNAGGIARLQIAHGRNYFGIALLEALDLDVRFRMRYPRLRRRHARTGVARGRSD